LFDLEFTIVDTAGYEDEDPDTLPGRMRMQTEAAIAGAQVALFLIDGRVGVTPLDEEIARWLRSSATPVVLAVNKAEGKQGDNGILESYALGFGDPIAISGEHGEGMADLFQSLLPHIDGGAFEVPDPEAPDAILKMAIVGRPNAGKSTLINKILGENRLITGPEAGITRDSISVDWIWTDPSPKEREPDEEGNIPPMLTERRVRLIDTAGMRKRAKVQDKLEKLSVADARHAIDFAEVVVLLLDATKGLEVQDLKIADRVIQEGRALIIAINKWDVAVDGSGLFKGIRAALEEGLSQLKGVPMIAVSALTGKGLDQMISAAFDAREAWNKRVPTGILNPPADVRDFRQPDRRIARQLCALFTQRYSPRFRFWCRTRAHQFPFIKEPVRGLSTHAARPAAQLRQRSVYFCPCTVVLDRISVSRERIVDQRTGWTDRLESLCRNPQPIGCRLCAHIGLFP